MTWVLPYELFRFRRPATLSSLSPCPTGFSGAGPDLSSVLHAPLPAKVKELKRNWRNFFRVLPHVVRASERGHSILRSAKVESEP